MSILKNLFLYYSRFVSKEAVKGVFLSGSSRDYECLMQEAMAVPDDWRNPNITDYIFGIDDQAVHKRISSVSGMFLFVDYSSIVSSVDGAVDVKTDKFKVSITVASPTPEDHDQATELLRQDAALDAVSAIRRKMRDDIDEDTGAFRIAFPSTLQPFVAHALANSIGWSMEFEVQGVDMA